MKKIKKNYEPSEPDHFIDTALLNEIQELTLYQLTWLEIETVILALEKLKYLKVYK